MARLFFSSVVLATIISIATAAPPSGSYKISDYIRAAQNGGTPADTQLDVLSSTTPSSTAEPCAQISSLVAQKKIALPADIALACLKSVPLQKDEDALQIAGLKTFVEFQSDLAYLKDPPPGYLYPAVDIMGGLDKIGENLKSDFYLNEYDFQMDIFNLVSSAYDGHFSYLPDILGVFSFQRVSPQADTFVTYSIFSVSQDGINLPSVYSFLDQAALVNPNASHYKASPIVKINNEDVETWLNSYASMNGGQQDPDANYNFLFPNVADVTAAEGFGDMFTGSTRYQGTDTILAFGNGTTSHILTVATPNPGTNFTSVTDGKSFFKRFCTGNALAESRKNQQQPSTPGPKPLTTEVPYKAVPTSGLKPPGLAYPKPIAIAVDKSVAGYLPESQSDLAVLSIPNYGPTANVDFQDVIRELLATAKAQGKRKLIVDLRGNPGGTVLQAYDTFRQLFPSLMPFGAGNYRANDLFDFAGQVASTAFANDTAANFTVENDPLLFAAPFPFNFREELNAMNTDFSSWKEFFGPHVVHGDNYTSLTRMNLSDILQTQIPVYGFINDTKPQPQTFAPKDIVLLQDGACASTCTIFSEFMKSQGHVRQIVVGGRKQTGPMQGVGGIKGSNIQGMFVLFKVVVNAFTIATPEEQASFNKKFGGASEDMVKAVTIALNRASPGGESVVQASVNFRNNIRQNDTSETPIQYVYEAADCRFFYTAQMYANQELVWDRTYQLAWGNGTCVPGSTGQPSSLFGVGYINSAAPAEAKNFFGGNDTVFPSGNLGAAVGATHLPVGPTSAISDVSTNGAGGRKAATGASVAFAFAVTLMLL